jgi:predicted DNA-binding protein (MmcQ/YjbR family)
MQQSLIDYALGKPGAEATFPFGPEVLVFKVMGKMFGLTSRRDTLSSFNLKCDPERAIALRAAYPAVKPGYYMNKQHWNTIELDGSLTEPELQRMIDHSYELIVRSLKKAERQQLSQIAPD